MKLNLLIIAMLILTASLVIIPMASATLSFSNYAQLKPVQDSKYGQIDVFKGNIIFPDEKVATYVLADNTDQCLIDCHASGTVTLLKDGTLFDSIKFLGGDVKTSQIYLVGAGDKYDVEVPDYKNVCEEVPIEKNDTQLQVDEQPIDIGLKENKIGIQPEPLTHEVCNDVQVGTHTETRFEDLKYNGDKLPAGTYDWRIDGTKDKMATVDWVVSVGKDNLGSSLDLTQWATWTSSFNSGLMDYYTMNETSGTWAYDSVSTNNINFSTGTVQWNAGKINGSVYLYNKAVEGNSTTNFALGNNFTIAFWANTSLWADGAGAGLLGINNGSTFNIYVTASNTWYASGGLDMGNPTKLTNNAWAFFVITQNDTKTVSYINGSYTNSVNKLANPSIGKLQIGRAWNYRWNGNIDEVGVWNRTLSASEVTNLWNAGLGLTYDNQAPRITVVNSIPLNNANISTSSVTFGCNVTQIGASVNTILLNITNGVTSWTQQEVLGLYLNSTFYNTTMVDGTYSWNCIAYGDNANGTSTIWTLNKDTTIPNVSISYPTGIVSYAGAAINLNFSATDSHIDTCWRDYAGVNTTMSCTANTTFVYLLGNNTINVWVNDTFGNLAYATTNWTMGIIVNSATYNTTGFETANQNYSINYAYVNILSSSANIYYDGKAYPSVVACSSGNCTASNSIDIPLVTGAFPSQNKSFYWVINSYDGSTTSQFTSLTYQQNISIINMTYCTSGVKAMNFTAYDESNKTRINPYNFDSAFNYYLGLGTVYKNLSVTNSSTPEIDICLSQNLTHYVNAIIAYTGIGNAYPARNMFYQNYAINNATQNIYLPLLSASTSTLFILAVQDQYLLPVKNVLVNWQTCNNSAGFTNARTDSQGQTTGYFDIVSTLYQFWITNNSQIIMPLTPCAKVVPLSSPYTITFNLGNNYNTPFVTIGNQTGITSSIVFNKTTNTVMWTYIDTSVNFNSSQLIVTGLNYSGTIAPVICTVNGTLASQISSCNLTNAGSYNVQVYINENNQILVDNTIVVVETFSSVVGYYGVFLAFFILLLCAFIFKYDERAAIWMIFVGTLFCNIVGLINFGYTFLTAQLCITIIITVILER